MHVHDWPRPDNGGWRDHAACREMDTALFFPERGDWRAIRAIKAICDTCPVKRECLDCALYAENDADGIYGGLTARARMDLRAKLKRDAGIAPNRPLRDLEAS